MQKIIITAILSTCNILLVTAQKAYYSYAAPYLFSSNTGRTFTSALTAAFNPSSIPYIKNFEAGLYAEKKYLADINMLLLSACVPFNNNGVSVMIQRYGNTLFNENTLGLAYGKSIGVVNVGVIFQHIQIKIQNATPVSLIKAGVASLLELAGNVFVSCRIINPDLFAKTNENNLRAASSYSLSIGIEPSDEVCTAVESLKEEGRPLSLIFSMYYRFHQKLTWALNWSTYTNQPYTAVSWRQNNFVVEAGCSYHSMLGVSPTICFLYKKATNK